MKGKHVADKHRTTMHSSLGLANSIFGKRKTKGGRLDIITISV